MKRYTNINKKKKKSFMKGNNIEYMDDFNANNNIVPIEIDTHFHLYGKHAWEVSYGEQCPVCERQIDEYGLCACGTGSE